MDLSSCNGAVERAEALRAYLSEHRRDFKAEGLTPQMYGVVARLDATRSLLALRYPHYLGDGHSNQILERAILAWLRAGSVDVSQPACFATAIERDQAGLSESEVASARDFWRQALRGSQITLVPREWFSRSTYKCRAVMDIDRAAVERIRQSNGLLMRTLYTAALSFAFRELLGVPNIVIRNFVLRKPSGESAASIYPRLFLEAFPIDQPLEAGARALLGHAKQVTSAILGDGDHSVHLVLNGLFDRSAENRQGFLRAVASLAGRAYGAFMGAGDLERRVLRESLASLVTSPNQVDVFLNFMPEPPPLSTDATFLELLRELKGRYMRKCGGGMKNVFALDVFEDGPVHRLSLDSPFSDEADARLLRKISEFMAAC